MQSNREPIFTPKLLVEGVIIVISILLAFWIEAWWQDRVERGEEHRSLIALRSDLVSTLGLIENGLAYREKSNTIVEKLLEAAAHPDSLQIEETDALLSALMWYWSFIPPEGAISSLLQGGSLPIISNVTLRGELAELPSYSEWVKSLNQTDASFTLETLMPYFVGHSALAQIGNHWGEGVFDDLQPSEAYAPVRFPVHSIQDHRELLASREFQGLLVFKHSINTEAMYAFSKYRIHIENLVSQVELELDRLR